MEKYNSPELCVGVKVQTTGSYLLTTGTDVVHKKWPYEFIPQILPKLCHGRPYYKEIINMRFLYWVRFSNTYTARKTLVIRLHTPVSPIVHWRGNGVLCNYHTLNTGCGEMYWAENSILCTFSWRRMFSYSYIPFHSRGQCVFISDHPWSLISNIVAGDE